MRLYISDLDGTLLTPEETLSEYTLKRLNNLIEQGIHFTVATARSIHSALPILESLHLKEPIILNNGNFIYDPLHQKYLVERYLEQTLVKRLIEKINAFKCSPYLFSTHKTVGDRIFYKGIFNKGEEIYVEGRESRGDKRFKTIVDFPVGPDEKATALVVINTKERLDPLYAFVQENFDLTYHYTEDIYSHYYWLEISPKGSTKQSAARYVKAYLNASELICFGDHLNDLSMFEIADWGYAVSNAHPVLKASATKVIGSNLEDGVVKCIEEIENKKE